MKKHINYRNTAIKILFHHYRNNTRLYESIDFIFKKNSTSPLNKNSIIFIVQGVIRNQGEIDFILEKLINNYYKKIPMIVKIILRIGVFQIKKMESPNYAIINTLVETTKNENINFYKLVNAVLRKSIKFENNFKTYSFNEKSKLLNHPEWMYKKWINDYGLLYADKIIDWNNSIPDIWFRININKYDTQSFEKILKHLKINFSRYEHNENYYKVSNSSILINNNIFKNGLITVQNPFSNYVCKLLDPKESDVIIDACASPGGKTAYISELMNNKGVIIAYDINKKRIELLKNTIKRMKVKNVDIIMDDTSKSKLPKADKILLDVPCSGTGVLDKYPDIKWRKSFTDIQEMALIQNRILTNASKYLKTGGTLVYSTCSIEKEENINTINNFLHKNQNFKIKNIDTIIPKEFINKFGMFESIPFKHKIDGGFAASLIKNAN